MAFTFAAFTYIVALIIDAFLIFFAIFHVRLFFWKILSKILFSMQIIAFDELKTDYKNPIDQCASLNPLVLPEYLLHILFNVLFLFAGEWFSIALNAPLVAYHIHRWEWHLKSTAPHFKTNGATHSIIHAMHSLYPIYVTYCDCLETHLYHKLITKDNLIMQLCFFNIKEVKG